MLIYVIGHGIDDASFCLWHHHLTLIHHWPYLSLGGIDHFESEVSNSVVGGQLGLQGQEGPIFCVN